MKPWVFLAYAFLCLMVCCLGMCSPRKTQENGSPQPETQAIDTIPSTHAVDSMVSLFKERYQEIAETTPAPDAKEVTIDDFYTAGSSNLGTLVKREFAGVEDCTGDSIFHEYYSTGYVEGGLSSSTFLTYGFSPLKNGIGPGMSMEEVKALLGQPRRSSPTVLTFAVYDEVDSIMMDERVMYDGVRLLFDNSGLIAVWFLRKGTC